MTDNNTCDRCGKNEEGIGWFAKAFKKARTRKGKPDPGNLCGSCAGRITGSEIGSNINQSESHAGF